LRSASTIFFVEAGLLIGSGRVSGHAEAAAMHRGGGDQHGLALGNRQRGASVDAGDGQIGFQRYRRIGEDAQQVGQKAVALLRCQQ
jgi:hypothetical protein